MSCTSQTRSGRLVTSAVAIGSAVAHTAPSGKRRSAHFRFAARHGVQAMPGLRPRFRAASSIFNGIVIIIIITFGEPQKQQFADNASWSQPCRSSLQSSNPTVALRESCVPLAESAVFLPVNVREPDRQIPKSRCDSNTAYANVRTFRIGKLPYAFCRRQSFESSKDFGLPAYYPFLPS